LKHVASAKFWALYAALPAEATADKNYALLKDNPQHPSLQKGRSAMVSARETSIGYSARTLKAVCSGFG